MLILPLYYMYLLMLLAPKLIISYTINKHLNYETKFANNMDNYLVTP